jgi:hypothetical protein
VQRKTRRKGKKSFYNNKEKIGGKALTGRGRGGKKKKKEEKKKMNRRRKRKR